MLLTLFGEYFAEFVVAIVTLTIGWFWGFWRANTAWKKKHFRDRIALSLTVIFQQRQKKSTKTELKIRTLFEKKLEEVFPNKTMRDLINRAIAETKVGDPLLRFAKDEAWYILNPILNQIAELFPLNTFRYDMGLEVTQKTYLFCVTFEREGDVRMQKTRILIVDKEKFLNFPDEGEVTVSGSFQHQGRVHVLRFLKKEYRENPHLFKDIEIYI